MKKKDIKVSIFKTLNGKQPTDISWEEIVNLIRGDSFKLATANYRQLVSQRQEALNEGDRQGADYTTSVMRKLKLASQAFLPSVTVSGGRAKTNITGYTGAVMVDFDHVDADRLGDIADIVTADPHTFLAYTTISGQGLRVISFVEGEVGDANFAMAWRTVNDYYARLVGIDVDMQCKNATRLSVICHDPKAYFNPTAVGLRILNFEFGVLSCPPLADDELSNYELRNQLKIQNSKFKTQNSSFDSIVERVIRMVESKGCYYSEGHHNEYISNCLYLMNRFGVSEVEATQWALREFADYDAREHSVAATARSCYRNVSEHGTYRIRNFEFGVRNCPPLADDELSSYELTTQNSKPKTQNSRKRRFDVSELEDFITEYMEVRRNTLNHTVEVKLSGEGQWQQLNDTIENSLWRAMQLNGIDVDVNRLHILLTSNFAPEFHPLRDYLDHLAPWDGTTDHIGQLAAMVTVKQGQQLFDRCFRKWLVAMIASALDEEVVNHVILTLVGRQGCYKTSFLQNVLPPQLQQYYTTKSNSQRITKDDLFTLTEYLIVNMEEIDTMPASEFNQLKAIVTQKFVNERPAYGRNKVHRPHVASICATGNVLQYISEDAHRRWATFEVDHIQNPWTAAIPYDGIYAHAYALYKSGFRYWFDEHEVDELNNHVRQFETPHPEHELIMTHYRKPGDLEGCVYVTASQILTRFGNCGIRLSLSKIGKAMKELGFKNTHTRNGNFWSVVERTSNEVHSFIPSDSDNEENANHSKSTTDDDVIEFF